MARINMEKEQVQIQLKYSGPDVDDGSMSIEDVVPILQGFSSAYGKIAANIDPSSIHRLRIVGVRPGSANIILEIWKKLAENANSLTAISIVGSAGFLIIRKILGVIKIKRHVKKQPFSDSIAANNSIVIINSDNVRLEVPLELFELFKSKAIDSDINKMIRPLDKDRIDEAEISALAPDGTILQEKITVDERPYFETEEITTTTTQETWLTVKLNSLTKTTNSGYAFLGDGSRIFYRYVGSDPLKLHNLFPYDGPLRVFCIAQMDENLKVNTLDILDLEKLQDSLFDSH